MKKNKRQKHPECVGEDEGRPQRKRRIPTSDGRSEFTSGNMNKENHEHTNPTKSPSQIQAPGRWAWIPGHQGHANEGMFDTVSGLMHGMIPITLQNSQTATNHVRAGMGPGTSTGDNPDFEAQDAAQYTPSKSSSIQEDSLKRRNRRASRREAEEESSRRVDAGMRPHTVQVRSSGIIDSGCKGHLKWQEYIRDLTPRMLDMSVVNYEEQGESSKQKLKEVIFAKFEFLENEVTDTSFHRMIKTWMRRDRERLRRVHGGKSKPPPKYSDKQWETFKQYWDSPAYKKKSEKMSETRSKVVNCSRVGRDGYAGRDEKLVSFSNVLIFSC